MKKCRNLLMIFGASLLLTGCGDTTEPQNEEQQEQKQNDAASEDNPGEATTDEQKDEDAASEDNPGEATTDEQKDEDDDAASEDKQDDTSSDAQTDDDAQSDEPEEKGCPAGFTGENCDQCKEGFVGDNCDECAENLAGENCNIVNSCVHGTPNLGISGDGHCAVDSCTDHYMGFDCDQCLDNFTGENCDQCAENLAGENCDIRNSCVHGIPNLGLNGDGHCSECTDVFWGPDCDQVYFCVNGTPNVGLNGDGHCADCNSDWSGTDCDIMNECQNGDANTGIDGDGHCTACINDNFTGLNCDECAEGLSGENCDQCQNGTTDTMTDLAGKAYKTTCINHQFWMAENMSYQTGTFFHVNNNEASDATYGLLYNWATAKTVCPSGWHLPTKEEYQALISYVNSNRTSASIFLALISKSTHWTFYENQGGDDFGFTALPAGTYYSSQSQTVGFNAFFWTDTAYSSYFTYTLHLGDKEYSFNASDKNDGMSVRCVQNSN